MRRSAAVLASAITLACGGGPNVISEGRGGSYEPALAVVAGSVVAGSERTRPALIAGWYDTRDGNGEIYLRPLDGSGRPSGPEHRLTTNRDQSYEVSLDGDGDVLAAAWYDKASNGTLSSTVARDGAWRRSLGPGTRNPVVGARHRRIFCAWIAREGAEEFVQAAWWDADGKALGAPQRLGPASKTTWNLNAAIDEHGTAHVVWDAAVGTRSDELFIAGLTAGAAARAPAERLSQDDGVSSKYPDIAIENGRIALTWFDTRGGNSDIYLRVGDIVRRVTSTPGESIGAYLAWNSGRIGLAWSDNTVGQHEVYFQPFDASAAALAEPRRITWSSAASLIPAIRPWRTGFALAWNEYTPPVDRGHGGRSVIATATVR